MAVRKSSFGGKHDNVVLAIQNGEVDAGTVHTDTLERMVTAGDIELSEFKILAKKDAAVFLLLSVQHSILNGTLSKLIAFRLGVRDIWGKNKHIFISKDKLMINL